MGRSAALPKQVPNILVWECAPLPPLRDMFDMAGMDLPGYLGKKQEGGAPPEASSPE